MKYENWLLGFHKQWKLMYSYIHGRKEALVGFMTSRKKDRLTGAQELSKLLSFEQIKAKTFYQIQKDLNTIAKTQEKINGLSEGKMMEAVISLSEKWEKTMGLLGNANQEAQQKRWKEIVERYYREIDGNAFEVFVLDQKKDIKWDCDYVQMMAGYNLASIGLEKGWEILENVGITGETLASLKQKINSKVTKRSLKQAKKPKYENKPTEFYEMWGGVIKMGYSISEDITLLAWIGVLNNIKVSNERNDS